MLQTTPLSLFLEKTLNLLPKLYACISSCLTVRHRLPQLNLNCTHCCFLPNGPQFQAKQCYPRGNLKFLDFSDPIPPSPAPRGLVLHLISLSSSSAFCSRFELRLLLLTYSVALVSRFSCLFSLYPSILMTSIFPTTARVRVLSKQS